MRALQLCQGSLFNSIKCFFCVLIPEETPKLKMYPVFVEN